MAIENGVQNAELGYILDPAFQIENLNGKPVVGGYICIYEAGTDNKYISYENFDGAQNPFKIPLKADGRAVILGDPSLTYDVYAYDSYGNQLFSRLNVQCNVPGNISIKGADTRIKNTDGTLDISLQTMGNNVREYTVNTRNKLLDVQSPLYFVENSQSATIIGIKGGASGYVTKDYVDSVVSGKLDTSAFSAVSGDFLTDKFEYDDNFNITGYDGSAFASNGQTYSAGTNIDITDNVISVTGLPDSADIENAISSAVTNVENKFEYNENNYITAYNSSAFAGTNYSAGDYVSIENDTISVTGLQPSGDYATHDDLTAYQPSGDYATKEDVESATSGKMDVTGMTAYQPSGDYATHDDLTAYQPAGDYYSASNPSGFITNDAITGLQPSGDYVTHDEMTAYQPSGDYATHDDLTGYATTALVSSVSSELYSAISGISGDYELVAGEGVELVDDPNAKTTTINVTAEGTPVTAIEQMIESATSGISAAISGSYTLVAGNGIQLTDDDNARTTTVSVSGDYATITQLNEKVDSSAIVTGHTASFVDGCFEALVGHPIYAYYGAWEEHPCLPMSSTGMYASGTYLVDSTNTARFIGFNTSGISADPNGGVRSVLIGGYNSPEIKITGYYGSLEFTSAGGQYTDNQQNVLWKIGQADHLFVTNSNPEYQNIAIDISQAPRYIPAQRVLIGNNGVSACYAGNSANIGSANAPATVYGPDGLKLRFNDMQTVATVGDVYVNITTASDQQWHLTASIQKREIEYDADTSAITAIAGSAIGGGGGVPQSAFDELKQSYDALSALFATYSGQWLLPNEGEE